MEGNLKSAALFLLVLLSSGSNAGMITADYSYTASNDPRYRFEGVVIFDDDFSTVIASNGAYGLSYGDPYLLQGISFLDFRMYMNNSLITSTTPVENGILTQSNPAIQAVRFAMEVATLEITPQLLIGDMSTNMFNDGVVSSASLSPVDSRTSLISDGMTVSEVTLSEIDVTLRDPPGPTDPIEPLPVAATAWLICLGLVLLRILVHGQLPATESTARAGSPR